MPVRRFILVYIDKPKNSFYCLDKRGYINGGRRRATFDTIGQAVSFVKEQKLIHLFITDNIRPLWRQKAGRQWFLKDGTPCSWKRVRACRW